ncbi:hypothetical protein LY78DRAFT_26840 [Colletotrichum sublineola]|nr:hypothetical protein LY78DRAFT_26840 [Colletotrichum sublineola]
MKENHTVIDKWLFRLKLRPGQTGFREEFDLLLGGGLSSKERYVEWKRVWVSGYGMEDTKSRLGRRQWTSSDSPSTYGIMRDAEYNSDDDACAPVDRQAGPLCQPFPARGTVFHPQPRAKSIQPTGRHGRRGDVQHLLLFYQRVAGGWHSQRP